MFGMSGLLHAQTHQEGLNNPLLGTWILEDLSVFRIEGNDSIPVLKNTLKWEPFGVFDNLVFQEDILTVSMFGYTVAGNYNINTIVGKVDFHFASSPFYLDYEVRNNKLYLKQQLSYSQGASEEVVYCVLSTYKSQ